MMSIYENWMRHLDSEDKQKFGEPEKAYFLNIMKTKIMLMATIKGIVEKNELRQREVAHLLSRPQSRISDLLNFKYKKFSLEDLFVTLNKLNCEIDFEYDFKNAFETKPLKIKVSKFKKINLQKSKSKLIKEILDTAELNNLKPSLLLKEIGYTRYSSLISSKGFSQVALYDLIKIRKMIDKSKTIKKLEDE